MRDAGRYESGPDAPLRAAASAWARVGRACTVVIVEGISDQVAVQTAAEVRGVRLLERDVVVLPIGGAHAIANTLAAMREQGVTAPVCGLYDAAEEPHFARALAQPSRCGSPRRDQLERWGFFACVDDLEDELLRSAGDDLAMRVVIEEGDRAPFRILRAQPAWRAEPFPAQLRRFIGAGSRRKLRYAEALVRALGPDGLPRPLAALVEVAVSRPSAPNRDA